MSDNVKVPVEISLGGMDVNALISKAILESKIGDEIRRVIGERLTDWNLRRVIESAVDACLSDAVKSLLSQNGMHDKFAAAVKEKITDESVRELVNKMWDRLSSR